MDKKETTNHIYTRLQAGITFDEIVDELSHIFNASPEVIERFVNKVISDHPVGLEQSPTQIDLPDWMEPLPSPIEIPTAKPSHLLAYSDLPPGLQSILNDKGTSIDDIGSKPVNATPAQE